MGTVMGEPIYIYIFVHKRHISLGKTCVVLCLEATSQKKTSHFVTLYYYVILEEAFNQNTCIEFQFLTFPLKSQRVVQQKCGENVKSKPHKALVHVQLLIHSLFVGIFLNKKILEQ